MIDAFDLNFVGITLLFLIVLLCVWVNLLEKRVRRLEVAAAPTVSEPESGEQSK